MELRDFIAPTQFLYFFKKKGEKSINLYGEITLSLSLTVTIIVAQLTRWLNRDK